MYVLLSQQSKCKNVLLVRFSPKCPRYWKPRSSYQPHLLFEMATSLNSALAWFRKRASGRQKLSYFKVLKLTRKTTWVLGMPAGADAGGTGGTEGGWDGWDGGWEMEKRHSHRSQEGLHHTAFLSSSSSLLASLQTQPQLRRNRQAVGQALTNGSQGCPF